MQKQQNAITTTTTTTIIIIKNSSCCCIKKCPKTLSTVFCKVPTADGDFLLFL